MSEPSTETEGERAQRIFDEERALCDRFITEFGGEYNSGGIRHRVMIYAGDMRRIMEMCRYLRDEAISAQHQVDDGT